MSEIIDDVAPGGIELAPAPEHVCSVTYTLDEEYTGFRTVEHFDSEGEVVSEQIAVKDISVSFTDGTVTHTRNVNVCFDESGAYDHEATLTRIIEVAHGVEQKIAAGVISE